MLLTLAALRRCFACRHICHLIVVVDQQVIQGPWLLQPMSSLLVQRTKACALPQVYLSFALLKYQRFSNAHSGTTMSTCLLPTSASSSRRPSTSFCTSGPTAAPLSDAARGLTSYECRALHGLLDRTATAALRLHVPTKTSYTMHAALAKQDVFSRASCAFEHSRRRLDNACSDKQAGP